MHKRAVYRTNYIMKHILSILLALAIAINTSAQTNISLNGQWKFWIPECTESANLSPTVKAEKHVSVPHTYNVMDGLEDYAGWACYSRTLPITSDMKGKLLRVNFNGVYHDAVVYVNGNEVGQHLNAGYSPFSFDITPFVDFADDASNIILVKCNNGYSEENLPWKRKFDWANDGGIYRDVTLHVSGRQSLRYVHVTPKIELADSTAIAQISIKLWQPSVKTANVKLKITENSTGKTVYEGSKKLKVNKSGTFDCDVDCGKVALWHFDNPALYTYEATLVDGTQIYDQRTECFGFRVFKVEGDHFTLNGEAVRLPGLENMPGSNPDFGMAESHEYMAKTVQLMKDLNCTITRYHWAQDDYRYHLMDSLGMLVQEELSWWQGPYKELGPSLMATAKRQLEELIEAHYNHPSIFAWGMSNEVGDNQDDVVELGKYARKLDSNRIIDVVCNHMFRELDKDPSFALDLPTWNEYIGTWHADNREQLPGYFNDIEKNMNGRPLLISESGLCEPAFTGGDARRVDEMIYHIGEWKKHQFVCGYIYFCLEDYRTQMGEEGIGKDRIRRHGVCNKRLEPKASYYVLQQIMCPIDVTVVKPEGGVKNNDTLANIYDIDNSNTSAEITIRVKDDIPSYKLRGYSIIYADNKGVSQSIALPDLNPGEDFTFILKNVNNGYNFNVIRPDGNIVLKY